MDPIGISHSNNIRLYGMFFIHNAYARALKMSYFLQDIFHTAEKGGQSQAKFVLLRFARTICRKSYENSVNNFYLIIKYKCPKSHEIPGICIK